MSGIFTCLLNLASAIFLLILIAMLLFVLFYIGFRFYGYFIGWTESEISDENDRETEFNGPEHKQNVYDPENYEKF